MKKRNLILGLVIGLFLIANVSAGIYFSQPEEYYNLGDIIEIEVDISPILEGFVKVDLVCEGGSIIVFQGTPNEQGKVNIKFPLTFSYIETNSGNCYFNAEYSDLSQQSRNFEISQALNVKLNSQNFFSKPGEEILVAGTAKRLNDIGINGDVELTIPVLKLDNEIDRNTTCVDDCELICDEKFDLCSDDCEADCEGEDEACADECEIGCVGDCEDNETCIDECETPCIEDCGVCFDDCESDCNDILNTCESNCADDCESETKTTELDNGVFYGKVVDGKFSITFSLAEDTPAGDYRIDVLAYEQDSAGKKTSEGLAMANLKILQILTKIEIPVNSLELNPGEKLSFRAQLLDQSDVLIDKEISIIIKNEYGNSILEKIVESDETVEYDIATNLTSGYYTIEALSDGISELKEFYVREKEIISFELKNDTLIVTNIGNIPYKKSIQINVGEQSFVKKLNLKLGEGQEFRLEGYDGEYDVWISDGETEISKSGVSLTGSAVNVKAIGSSAILALKTPIVWIFFIVVLGAGILFIFRKVLKKKSFAYPFKGKFNIFKFHKPKVMKLDAKGHVVKESKEPEKSKKEKPEKKESKEKEEKEPEKSRHSAEHVLVLKGQKNRATVVALKIKNKITKPAKQSLAKAIEHVYETKGAVYEQGDYVFIVFSPLMTRSFKNEVKAVKAAEKIILALKEHNKKFKDKIEFGIGINSGNIISKMENKKLKFTALGNLIAPAKRLATASNEQILVTKQAYERGISDIKAEKSRVSGGDVYRVRKVLDHEKNKRFIEGFLKRMEADKKEK